jgi:hypothetical protein
LRAQLLGTWGPTLPPREARAVAMTRWALAEPPNANAFEGIAPTDDEREAFRALLKLKATDPSSPKLLEIRRKLADYEAMLVVISSASISFRTADQTTDEAYTIVDERDAMLSLQVKSEHIDVQFIDHDHIVMRGTRTMRLTRDVRSAGGNATDMRTDAPTPSAPPAAATGGPADACTAYADCIDQMPQLPGDHTTMAASSRVIRGWDRTPEILQQCASALATARGAALCP